MNFTASTALLIALTFSLAACGDSDAKEEALRKEREALAEVDAPRAATSGERRTSLTFVAQPGWVEEEASGMRKAQFRLPGEDGDCELVVFFLGGSAQDNLVRWAGQFEGDPAESLANVQVKDVGNLRMHTFDRTGTMLTDSMGNALNLEGQRMLSTVIEATDGAFPGGQKYFVRLYGPSETIDKWESSYFELLASL